MPVTALSQGIALIVSKEVSQNCQLKAPVNDMLPNSRIEFQQQWLGLLQLDPCIGAFRPQSMKSMARCSADIPGAKKTTTGLMKL